MYYNRAFTVNPDEQIKCFFNGTSDEAIPEALGILDYCDEWPSWDVAPKDALGMPIRTAEGTFPNLKSYILSLPSPVPKRRTE